MVDKNLIKTKPEPEDYGFVQNEGFDGEPSGWVSEGGEEAYENALKEWEESIS